MALSETRLPQHSILNNGIRYDYVDSFTGELNDKKHCITSAKVGKAFFTSAPVWVAKLLALRDRIAGVSGLKTSGNTRNRQQQLNRFTCEPGDQLGLFKVYSKTEHEVVLGEDDKHLNFRVSLYLEPESMNAAIKKLTISTVVKFNNLFGRLYFLPVRPFHRIIVPKMLKGIIRELEKNY